MKTIDHLLWMGIAFLSLFASCTEESLQDSANGVALQPSVKLTSIQAEARTTESTFQPEKGSIFIVERTDDNSTPAATYIFKDGKMVSDSPLLLPKAGNYSFRIYGKSENAIKGIPVAFCGETEVSKDGSATFALNIVCAAMQIHLQSANGSAIADGQAEITLPGLSGIGSFNIGFTVANETAIEADENVIPSGHNGDDYLLFHPGRTSTVGKELITISYEGRIYRYSPPSTPDFTAGKRYIYTLRLGTAKAELVTEKIADFKPFILTKDNNGNLPGIYTEQDLIDFRNAINSGSPIDEWIITDGNSNRIINLYNDIALTQEWTPINLFEKLRFYGNGNTISGITIKQTSDYNGFFGRITGGSVIFRLNLADINIEYAPTANSYCGIICGYANSSVIQDIHLKNIKMDAAVEGKFSLYLSGCTGRAENSRIKNISIENASIKGTGSSNIYIAGISGYAVTSPMEQITMAGIQVQGECTGGSIVYAGGLAGLTGADSPIHHASLQDITIDAKAFYYIYCGGMVGCIGSPISQSKLTKIKTTSSTSKLIYNYTGGLAGYNSTALLENIELNDITSYAEATAIYSTTNKKYTPYLCNGGLIGRNGSSLHNIHASQLHITTSSSVEEDIAFTGAGGLVGFQYYSTPSIITQCSTDHCTAEGYRAGGIIGYNYNGDVIGCAATNVDIHSNCNSGGLIGFNYNGKNIFSCYSTGEVAVSGKELKKDYTYAGGLIGQERGNKIEGSYSTCNVINPSGNNDDDDSKSYVGSFLGGGGRSYTTSCYSTGSVNGSQDSYFIGSTDLHENSEIRFCYTTQAAFLAEIRGPSQLGGSAGWDISAPLPEDILRNKASITRNEITWKASSLWLIPSKGAHPVINMNYHGE